MHDTDILKVDWHSDSSKPRGTCTFWSRFFRGPAPCFLWPGAVFFELTQPFVAK